MAKNIVIFSDGTAIRSVTRIKQYASDQSVELGNPCEQIVFYHQGLGTNHAPLRRR